MLNIQGFGDNLTINNIRIGDLSPEEHKKIDLEKGGRNYKPLENVVVSHVKDSSTLICRKPSENGVKAYIEEELIDGLCCYSAVNQGQLNQTIVDAVVKHLTEEKLPTVPRSIRHKYMAAFLLASTAQITCPNQLTLKVSKTCPNRFVGISKNGVSIKRIVLGMPTNPIFIPDGLERKRVAWLEYHSLALFDRRDTFR